MTMSYQTPSFENLEPRLLLTTLAGGDTFEWVDESGKWYRIALEGDIIVEMIGDAIDDHGNAVLGDIAGSITSSAIGSTHSYDEAVQVIGSISTYGVAGEDFAVNALASADEFGNGDTYGFSVATVNDILYVRLLKLTPNATLNSLTTDLTAFLQNANLIDNGFTDNVINLDVTAVPALASQADAMAVDPDDGVGYFLSGDTLYSVDRDTGEVNSIGASGLTNVKAMAFDSNGDLYVTGYDSTQAATEVWRIAQISTVDGTIVPGTNNFIAGLTADDTVTAMEFIINGNFVATVSTTPAGGDTTWSIIQRYVNGTNAGSNPLKLAGGDDAPNIEDMTWARGANNTPVLVGIDISQDNGPRLVTINYSSGTVTPISQAGVSVQAGLSSIASYAPLGDNVDVLYGVNIDPMGGTYQMLLGSASTLQVSTEDGVSLVQAINASDFRPTTGSVYDGLLFFVARWDNGGTPTDTLYSIDVTLPTTAQIQASLRSWGVIQSGDDNIVTSIAWDVYDDGGSAMLLAHSNYAEFSSIFNIDLSTTTYSIANWGNTVSVSVTSRSEPVMDITSIEFVEDDPTSLETSLVAVRSAGRDSTLVRVDLTDGTCLTLQNLPLPEDPNGNPVAGENIQGLAWNPLLVNPFTGEYGVLLGTDVGTDQLVMIDYRFTTHNLFAIYVSQSSDDSSFSIANFNPDQDGQPMLPYEGSVGQLRVRSAQGGDLVLISAPANTGSFYFGDRTPDLDPDDPLDDLIPVLTGYLDQELGVRAEGIDDVGSVSTLDDVYAGLVIDLSLLSYLSTASDLADRLMGDDFDNVQEIAVMRDGTIIAVNLDGSENKLAFVDSTTGNVVGTVASVYDVASRRYISGIRAMDYGDHDPAQALTTGWLAGSNGEQQLFAIYDLLGTVPTESIGGNLGATISAGTIKGLTVTTGGIMYAVVDTGVGTDSTLYRINRDVVTGELTTPTSIGVIATATGSVTDITGLDADPQTGALYITGVEGGNPTLYTVSTATGEATQVGTGATGLGLAVGDTVAAISFCYSSDGTKTLYAVVDEAVDGNTLYTVDLSSGAATEVIGGAGNGIIELPDETVTDVDIQWMDFQWENGECTQLVAVDANDGGRIIVINWSDPGDSGVIETFADSGDFAGYTSDRNGIVYSINIDTAPSPFQVWASTGMVSTLGTINADISSSDFGDFTRIGVLKDVNGGTILSGVKTMSFRGAGSNLQQNRDALYVIDSDNYLWEVDPATGTIISTYYSLQDTDGVVQIESMDFEENGGLFGFDRVNGRLVDIAIALRTLNPYGAPSGTLTVGGTVATPTGSLRPTVSSISFDMENGRFLAVDNATGVVAGGSSSVMMELKGYTSNSATAQNINNVLIGGTITGMVDISGSVDGVFYAGWVLTGLTKGMIESTTASYQGVSYTENFKVGGDLRNLVSASAIGTLNGSGKADPAYLTGFEAVVTGKIGQIWSLESMIASYSSENVTYYNTPHDASSTFQQEIEFVNDPAITYREGDAFQYDFRLFRTDGAFFNDTFETAQYLGTMGISTGLDDGVIQLRGTLYGDYDDEVDFYGISLLAGQTITIQGIHGGSGIYIGVLDPDGRLIATDASDVDAASVIDQEFRFTADRAGVYRIAIGPAPYDGTGNVDGNGSYIIYLSEVGNLAIGGVKANVDFFNYNTDPSIYVARGDMGGVYTGGTLFFQAPVYSGNIIVETGSLRSIDASQVGLGISLSEFGVNIIAGQNIGLLRSRTLQLNIESAVIGGDLQLVDAMTDLYLDLSAGGGVGVIRAGTMATDTPSSIVLDTDNSKDDGFIDLIDIAGNMGTNGSGGAQIDCGENGDVRYMRVGGLIFQDVLFGWGDYDGVTLNAGQTATITDDSGATITIAPRHMTTDTFTGQAVDPHTLAAPDPEDLPFLTYRTYGIRGSGGSVLVDITSTGGFTAQANGNGVNAPISIGRITVQGVGRAVILDADGNGVSLEEQPSSRYDTDLKVVLGGATPIDVFEIIGGNFTGIANNTTGEIVNVVADSIGSLFAYGSIGIAKNSTGQTVEPRVDLLTTYGWVPAGYPFLQQHIGIVVNGNVDKIYSCSSIGNIMVNGQIDWVSANYQRAVNDTDGVFRGIAAPIFATGNICQVNIGEGVAPSGSGEFAQSGIFSLSEIRQVYNDSSGANIRGAIVGVQGVRNVTLTNGSIINADIIAGSFSTALEYNLGWATTSDIGSVTINGNGGIIGMFLAGHNVGSVTVNNGYGILNSEIIGTDNSGTVGNVTADGFGIRRVHIVGNGNVGNITATGRGALANTRNYSSTVRYSETDTYLPGTDQLLSRLNDIHLFLGTTAADPMDRQGLLQDIYAHGNGNLGVVSGYRITTWRGAPFSETGLSTFDFANSIKGFVTYPINASDTATNSIDGLEITTGKLGYFNPAQDVNTLRMTIAGLISNITIRGSLLGTSSISALGPNGNINKLTILGHMEGNVTSDGIIGVMTVGGNMTGNIVVSPLLPVRLALNSLTINGSFNGTFDVDGNVGTIFVGRDLGVTGDTLRINGNLGTLTTGKLRANSDMALDLNVLGNVNKMYVYGAMSGDAWIDGNLSQLNVYNTGNPIAGDLTVMGTLSKATITGDDWASAMIAGNAIGSVTIAGDLAAAGSITCLLGNISQVWIRGGDLLGTVSAPNGTIGRIKVTGSNLGAASLIEAGQVNLLQIDGSVLSGARIVIDDQLTALKIGGSIQSGSTVSVGSIRTLTVGGSVKGDFTLGYTSGGTIIRISGSLGDAVQESTFSADSDVKLYVSNILEGATISISRDLTLLQVSGTILGDVIVDGSITTLKAGSLNTAVIVSGMDMNSVIVTGAVTSSLIQAGINRGDDEDFDVVDDNGSQIARMGDIRKLQVGSANLSIIAAGGHIGSATVNGNLVNSSISSGMIIDPTQISNVLDGTNPMAVVADLNDLRGAAGTPVVLLWGNFNTATVKGLMTNSDLSAGVDPGADGVFNTADDVVSTSLTGGNSSFSRVTATRADAASTVVADAGLGRARIGAAASNGDVTYNVLTNADVLDGVAIGTLQGTAQAGTPVTYAGITITVTGSGTVRIYDDGVSTADIDSLVISGTNSKTQIVITGAGSVGRILTADDVVAGTLTYNGTLAGLGNALWMDAGTISTFSLGTLAAAVRGGRIGGNVSTLYLGTQGSGELRVGGSINVLQINRGNDPLLTELGDVSANTTAGAIAVDGGPGTTWVFDVDDQQIQYWDISIDEGAGNPVVGSTVHVYTYLNADPADSDAPLLITAMDLTAAGGDLLAVAEMWSLSPTVNVGAIGNTSLSLNALAILNNGRAYAIENAGTVALPWNLNEIYTDVVSTTIDSDGTQYVLREEAGEFKLYTINTTEHTLDPVGGAVAVTLAYGGDNLDNISSMDFSDEDGYLYLIGTHNGAADYYLYQVNADTADVEDELTFAESDTISANPVELAYMNIDAAQATWVVGDIVQNATGAGDRWTGVIEEKYSNTAFCIRFTSGTLDDLEANAGGDIENTTHAGTAGIDGAVDGVQIQTTNAHADWLVNDEVRDNKPNSTVWAGMISAVSGGDTKFNIRLTTGDFADIVRANGIQHDYPLTTADGTFTALTVNNDGNINAIIRDAADTQDTLVGLDTYGTFYNTSIGTVQIDTVDTDIIGMDIDAAGNILALDTSGGQYKVIRIDILTPEDSWAVSENQTIYDANTVGFTSNTSGEFYSFEKGAGAVNAGLLFSLGRDRLVQLNTSTGARTVVGYLRDIYGNFYFNDVYTLSGDDTGLLYTVLKDSDGMGGVRTADDGAALARIATTASGGNVRVSSPDSTVQPPAMMFDADSISAVRDLGGNVYEIDTTHTHDDWDLNDLVRNDSGTGWSGYISTIVDNDTFQITVSAGMVVEAAGGVRHWINEPFTAMAVDSSDTMYVIRRDGVEDQLFELDTTGEVTLNDVVQVGGVDTNIIGMGFDSFGNLVAYNNDGTNAGLINLSDPTSATHDLDPNNAVLVTAGDVLNADIDAYAIGRSGTSGFTAYAYDYDNAVGGLFYKSPGLVATLGTINNDLLDADYGRFTELMPLAKQANGVGLTSDVSDISYIDDSNVYVITADGNLYRYNNEGDLLAAMGPVKDVVSGESLVLTTFDYDTANTAMIAIDGTYNQLVTLNTDAVSFENLGSLGGDEMVDVTIAPNGSMYTLLDIGGTQTAYKVFKVDRDSAGNVLGVTNQIGTGNLFGERLDTDVNTGDVQLENIHSLDVNSSGDIFFVAHPDGVGAGMALYSMKATTGAVSKVADLTLSGSAVTDTTMDLCFSGSTLYAVLDVGGVYTLYRVNLTDGTLTEMKDTQGADSGAIEVGGAAATIKGMDAGSDGILLAYATLGAADYVIQINVLDPSASINLSTANPVDPANDDYIGFTVDANQRYYMIASILDAAPLANYALVRSTAATTEARMEPGSADAANLTDLSYSGGTFYTFDKIQGTNGGFASLNGTTQGDQFGITVESINNLYLGDEYAGRIVTTGNTFKNVVVNGDFMGTLYTAGQIKKFTETGNFSGTLYGRDGLGAITIRGAMLEGGLVATPGNLSSLQVTGLLSGGVSASRAGQMLLGSVGATGDVRVSLTASKVQVNGTVTGSMDFGSVGSYISGNLNTNGSDSANVQIHGNASLIRLNAGTDVGSYLKVDGSVGKLYGYGTHSGVIGIDEGASRIQMATIANGFLVVGKNVSSLTVTGNITSSVLSIGTTIGADGVYNTEDDRVTGGVLSNAILRGNFINSALVAGVLPNLSYGSGLPDEMWYYTGDDDATSMEDIDSAEVGGVLPSAINKVTIYGTTGTFAGGNASAIASESIGKITMRNPWSNLYTRSYVDPINAPEVDWTSISIISDNEVKIYFSELINTASLILSIDIDDDGSVSGATDTQGTVTITNTTTGEIIDDVTLSYTKETDNNGNEVGVLHIFKADLLDGDTSFSVELSGSLTNPNPPAILGLSGMRSSRRDMVATTAPMGTILDGSGDGVEGGDATIHFGEYSIASLVPEYEWWFGCTPTAAGMLMGYYDIIGFEDLIVGDASTQTDDVNDAIASSGTDATSGRAVYYCDQYGYHGTGPNGPAIAGTGSIGDYAIYDGVDDSDYSSPYPDLSDPAVRALVGVTPHDSNCLADFLRTSWSVEGATMGGSPVVYHTDGLTSYVSWVNSERGSTYSSMASYLSYGDELTLGTIAGEIANGRPVLLNVDSDGNGSLDHTIIAIGYNFLTGEYICYDTWMDGATPYIFNPVGNVFGVASAVTFQIADVA